MSDLSDLMQKDPLALTIEDVTGIVAHFRENRERYVLGQKLTVEKVKPTKAAKPAKGSVSLDDLDIEL